MKKTIVIIIIFTLFSKIFGLIRDIALSYFYGTSYISDAYLVAITIPSIFLGFIISGLYASFIPMYSKVELEEGTRSADAFTSNLLNISFIICTFVIIIIFPFTSFFVRLFAPGFDEITLELTSDFTRVTLFSIYFSTMVTIFSGYLQIKGNFIIPALIGLPLNIVIIVSIFLSYKFNLYLLSYGLVLAGLFQVLLMLPIIAKNKFKFNKIINFKNKHIRKLGYISIPIIFGVAINEINVVVDKIIASNLLIGSVSALNYASRLNSFIQGIFVWAVTTALYPLISKFAAESDFQNFKNVVRKSIIGIVLMTIPITIGALIFSEQIITIVFGRGAFDEKSITLTSQAMFFYSIGIIGFGLRDILTKAFFALQDTKIPVINAGIGMSVNIVLNIILSQYLGVGGIALATSIAATITTLLLFISLRKKIGSFGIKNISISFIKMLFASLIMGIISKNSYNFLLSKFSGLFSLIISILIGIFTYFIIIYFVRIKDIDDVVKNYKYKFKR